MDFAPYQDTDPERTRALSPPPNRTMSPPARNAKSSPPNRPNTDPLGPSSFSAPNHFSDAPRSNGFDGADIEGGRLDVNLFETSLPLRLDYEAMLAYLLLPPAGGVFLLVVEHKSDYVRCVCRKQRHDMVATSTLRGRAPWVNCRDTIVDRRYRFHAWQSSLLFAAIFVLHLVFSWSSILSWMLFVVDLGLIGFLTMHAYQDGMTPHADSGMRSMLTLK